MREVILWRLIGSRGTGRVAENGTQAKSEKETSFRTATGSIIENQVQGTAAQDVPSLPSTPI